MEDLNSIIKELKNIRKEEELNFTDDTLIDIATRILNTNSINSKPKEIKKENTNSLIEPPSIKQINLLNKHGVKIPDTKKEATLLIKNYFDNINKENI